MPKITFGLEYEFLSLNGASLIRVAFLTSTKFVVAYRDNANSSRGTCKIGTIAGTTVAFGASMEFELSSLDHIDITRLDDTSFALIWRTGNTKARVGTVSGSTITFGAVSSTWATMPNNILTHRITGITATKIVVTYTTGSGSNWAKVGTISGTTITFVAAVKYDASGFSDATEIKRIDDTHVLIIYADGGSGYPGTAIVGTVTGTMITFGGKNDFTIGVIGYLMGAAMMSATQFVVAYSDFGLPGDAQVKIGTIIGNNISYGVETEFSSLGVNDFISVVKLSNTEFAVCFKDVVDANHGTCFAGTIDGTVATFGAETEFLAANGANNNSIDTCEIETGRFIVAYGDGADANHGTVKVGELPSFVPFVQTSGNMFIKGPTQAASQANLFLKTTALYTGLLQSENAIFYIPCDQLPAKEIVKNKIWTDQGGWFGAPVPSVRLQSGIVSSGLAQTNALAGFTLTDSSAPYKDITGSSGLCLAIWNLGSLSSDAFVILAGFGNTLTSTPDNGIKINMDPGLLSVGLYASGQTSPDNFIPTTVSDPIFFVVDIRFSGGTTWLVRRSINGSNWSSPAILNFGFHFDNSAFAKFAFLNSSSVNSSVDEVILWSNNTLFTPQEISNLFSLGNTLIEPMTAYAANFAPKSVSGSTSLIIKVASEIDNGPSGESLFIGGSGIIGASWDISFFINGIEPRLSLLCPPLDPTASIQIKDSLIKIYQSRIDALINQLGKNVTLEFDPILTPCPNCIFDRIRKRSTGIFIPGGPRPFKKGRKCPWCKGRGLLETSVTKCIKCLIKWNPEDAENFGISIEQKNGVVRFKTFLTEADDLIRAKTAVSNKDIEDQLELRVRLLKGPIPVGLRERRYCISFWELI